MHLVQGELYLFAFVERDDLWAVFAAFADLRKLSGRTWICSRLLLQRAVLMEAVALGFA